MKMAYCPHCHGLPDLKPCSPYCLHVLKSCLSNHIAFGKEWSDFIGKNFLIKCFSHLKCVKKLKIWTFTIYPCKIILSFQEIHTSNMIFISFLVK